MPVRIGDLAKQTGVTPRTIRYYEELGLLPCGDRAQGKHRTYDEADVDRLRELKRLRDLLGLSLEELRQLVEAEDARAEIRRRFDETESPAERLELLDAALPHLNTQLGLVRRRLTELRELESDLLDRKRRIQRTRRDLTSDS
jgi:MerR family transcriptional regulator, repressor of the yfmOP operon